MTFMGVTNMAHLEVGFYVKLLILYLIHDSVTILAHLANIVTLKDAVMLHFPNQSSACNA